MSSLCSRDFFLYFHVFCHGGEHVAEEGESGGVGGVGGEEVSVERRKVVEDEACVVMFERLMAQKRMSLKA